MEGLEWPWRVPLRLLDEDTREVGYCIILRWAGAWLAFGLLFHINADVCNNDERLSVEADDEVYACSGIKIPRSLSLCTNYIVGIVLVGSRSSSASCSPVFNDYFRPVHSHTFTYSFLLVVRLFKPKLDPQKLP